MEEEILFKVEVETTQANQNFDGFIQKQDAAVSGNKKLGDSFQGVAPGLASFVNGIQAGTKASLAFIATPIGAVVAALGAGLAALTAYFKGSEKGQNDLNKVVAVGKAIFEQLMNVVEKVGEVIFDAINNPKQAIIDFGNLMKEMIINRFEGLLELIPNLAKAVGLLFEGEFVEAGKLAFDSVAKVATGIENASDKIIGLIEDTAKLVQQGIEDGKRLADLQAQIDRDERRLIVERSKVNLEVAQKRREAISQEGDVKRKTIQEAIALEEKLSAAEVAAKARILEQAKLELQNEGDTKEAKLKVAEAEAALIDAQAQRFEATLRFAKEIEKLDEEERKKKEKLAEEELKKSEEEKKRLQEEREEQYRIEAEQAENNRKFKEDQAAKLAKKEVEIEKLKNEALSGFLDKYVKENTKARVFLSALFKKDAISETIINTKAAAVAAYKSLAGIPIIGPILGAAAALAVGIFGAGQLAQIVGINFMNGGMVKKFAEGGAFTIGGKDHSAGGTKFVGSDGSFFEAQRGEGMFILKREAHADLINDLSRRNQKFGGLSWLNSGGSYLANGGQAAPTIVGTGMSAEQISSVVRATVENLPPIFTDVGDIATELSKQNQIIDRATV